MASPAWPAPITATSNRSSVPPSMSSPMSSLTFTTVVVRGRMPGPLQPARDATPKTSEAKSYPARRTAHGGSNASARRSAPGDRRRRGEAGRAPASGQGSRRRPRSQHEHRAPLAPDFARRRAARVPTRTRITVAGTPERDAVVARARTIWSHLRAHRATAPTNSCASSRTSPRPSSRATCGSRSRELGIVVAGGSEVPRIARR